MILGLRALVVAVIALVGFGSSSFAKETHPWVKQCMSDANLSMEAAAEFCQCLWDKEGPENVPPLNLMREMSPGAITACEKAGPNPWIAQCIKDSKMKNGEAYCKCIWEKEGPENVPPLSVMKEMGVAALNTCKK